MSPLSGGIDEVDKILLMAEEADGVDMAGSLMVGAEGVWVSRGGTLLQDCWHSLERRAL